MNAMIVGRSQVLLALMLALCVGPAVAQYKWTTPDGRTVYGDVPPAGGAQRLNERTPITQPIAAKAERTVALPYELQQVSSRQPVVLYTASECAPCESAKAHLNQRGIPFSEKTITSVADLEALKGLGFAGNAFPSLSIGREQTVGFESSSWDRLLTAAGYPRQSVLPSGYRQTEAKPMTPPPVQQMVVTTGATSGPGNTAPAAGNQQRAIDQYRAQLQEGRSAPAEAAPTTRF